VSAPRQPWQSTTSKNFGLVSPAIRIVSGSLGLVFGERLVVFCDRSRVPLAQALIDVAEELKARAQLVVLEDVELPREDGLLDYVLELLSDAQASVLLLGTEHSRPIRQAFVEATERLRIRHAHMIGLSQRGFVEGFAADPSRLADMLQAVGRRLAGARKLSYRTPAGTQLEIVMPSDARWTERGQLIRPGKFSNLPGGQLNALCEAVDGVYVADGSSNVAFAGSGDLRSNPVSFTIARGVVERVACSSAAVKKDVEAFLESEEHMHRVGHLVIGANPGVLGPIGEVMVDACAPGLQIVFGWTNRTVTGASWSTQASLALAGSSGDLDVDGAALLRGGRYVL
jgi:aminopeptidase